MEIRDKVRSSLYSYGMVGRNVEDCIDHILAQGISFEEVPEKSDSNLVDHARRELEIIGEEPEMIAAYLKVVQAFADMHPSGGQTSVAIPVLNILLRHKNISALTDYPDDWQYHDAETWGDLEGKGVWQSKRNHEALSPDGGKHYWLIREPAGRSLMFESNHDKRTDERPVKADSDELWNQENANLYEQDFMGAKSAIENPDVVP